MFVCVVFYSQSYLFNPLDFKGNYCATSNNTKLVLWPLMGGLLHLVQRGGAGRAAAPPSPLDEIDSVNNVFVAQR